MTRWKAAGAHLLVSIAVLASAAAFAIATWYPPSLFELSGADRLLVVLAVIDVTIGPLLTLLVYRHGKRGMKFDLAVIAILQAAFFAYGIHMFWVSRPVFLVGDVDRLELVFANEISDEALAAADPPWNRLGFARPTLVGLKLPSDPAARSELLFQEIEGEPARAQPRLYVDYDRVARSLLSRSRDVEELAHGATAARLEAILRDLDRKPASLRWLPITSSRGSAIQLVDAASGMPVAKLAGDPWTVVAEAGARRNRQDAM